MVRMSSEWDSVPVIVLVFVTSRWLTVRVGVLVPTASAKRRTKKDEVADDASGLWNRVVVVCVEVEQSRSIVRTRRNRIERSRGTAQCDGEGLTTRADSKVSVWLESLLLACSRNIPGEKVMRGKRKKNKKRKEEQQPGQGVLESQQMVRVLFSYKQNQK